MILCGFSVHVLFLSSFCEFCLYIMVLVTTKGPDASPDI